MNEIQLNLLPMKSGDCVHLRFGSGQDWYNIVIDSGPAGCAGKFRGLLEKIEERGEAIDLLCFSHIDDDHIKGAEQVLTAPSFDTGIIKEIWLNEPSEKVMDGGDAGAYKPATVETACGLWRVIRSLGLPCRTSVSRGDGIVLGNAEIKVLLPTESRLACLRRYWEEQIEKLHAKGKYLSLSGWKEDDSPTNGSSITLLISIDDKKLLLAGDAFPEDLEMACREEGAEEIHVMKLPHHGSDRNITIGMLEASKCRHFLISTEQNAYRPAAQAMELLAKYGKACGEIQVYGNYYWPRFSKGLDGAEIIALEDRNKKENVEGIVIWSE